MKSTKKAPSKMKASSSKAMSKPSNKSAAAYGSKPPVQKPDYAGDLKKAEKKAKVKSTLKTAGNLAGVIGTSIATVLADARFNRGADRVRGGRAIKVSPGDAWRAGKNKKGTK